MNITKNHTVDGFIKEMSTGSRTVKAALRSSESSPLNCSRQGIQHYSFRRSKSTSAQQRRQLFQAATVPGSVGLLHHYSFGDCSR